MGTAIMRWIDVEDIGRHGPVQKPREMDENSRERRELQQDEEHPVCAVRVLVRGFALFQATDDGIGRGVKKAAVA